MNMLTSKWVLIIAAIFVIAIILIFTGNKSVHHEISIKASPEKVWSVLMDTEKHDEWNPVMKLVKGEVSEGNNVTYQFTQDKDNISEIPITVFKIIPNHLLNQKGGIPMILTYNHKYILEPDGENTILKIQEDYKGIWVNFWNPNAVQLAYARLNNAIKRRSEE